MKRIILTRVEVIKSDVINLSEKDHKKLVEAIANREDIESYIPAGTSFTVELYDNSIEYKG